MKRLSFVTLALLASMAHLLLAQDCNNPLLGFFGLPSLDAPIAVPDLPYCAGLQATESCCSADTIATFQDRANALINDFNNYAAGRDLYIAQLRNSYLDRFNDILRGIDRNHQNDLRVIRQRNATLADELEAIIANAREASATSQGVNDEFMRNLDVYQAARSACFNTALEIQSSAWCLACNPNYIAEGVGTDGVVTFSEGLCQTISSACLPYFNQGANLNPLFTARAAYWSLSEVARYLRNYITDGVLNVFTIAEDPYNPLEPQQATVLPDEFVGTGDVLNPAQCQNLWEDNAQLGSLLNIGTFDPSVIGDKVWAPDTTETGLDFGALRLNPGDIFGAINNSTSTKRPKKSCK